MDTLNPNAFQMTTFSVLVVVPTLNESAHIENVIDSVMSGAPPDARLVVADGGSTDGTVEKVTRMALQDRRIRLVHNPARIQSAGINAAVQAEGDGADFLLRADAHAIYPPFYCRDLLDEIKTVDADAITVPMETLPKGGFATGVAAAQNSVLGTGGSAHRVAGSGGRYVEHGHHALMRIESFRAVGGYDDSQSHNEDAELDQRLIQSGARIWLTGRTRIGYVPRDTVAGLFKQYRAYGKGRAQTVLKHRLRPRLRQLLPLLVAPAVAAGVAAPVLGALTGLPWVWLTLPAIIWAAICLGYGLVLAVRKGDAAVAWSGPAAMTMHLAWSIGFLETFLQRRFRRPFSVSTDEARN
jgi:succinoglycan biosynthesis protein ExoA